MEIFFLTSRALNSHGYKTVHEMIVTNKVIMDIMINLKCTVDLIDNKFQYMLIDITF